jgi:hypothetical protein
MWQPLSSPLLAAMVLVIAGAGGPARAQEVDEPEGDRPPRPAPELRITAPQFDRWAFGADGDARTARTLFEARLKSRVGYIDHLCGLTPHQSRKLVVAGRGDIKRFFDRVEEMRNEVALAAADRNRLIRVVREVQLLSRDARTRLFGDDSLLAKNLATTLDSAQLARYQWRRDEDRLSRHQARVEWVARTLSKSLFLSEPQRLQLLVVLLEETCPPRGFGPSDYYGIIFQASRIAESKLRPIFDDAQWAGLRREFDAAKRQERTLRDSGYLPDDRPRWDSVRGGRGRGRHQAGATG